MSEYRIQDTTLTDIADAIRLKTGGAAPILVSEMANEIESIPTGGGGSDTSFVGGVSNVSERFDLDLETLMLEATPGYSQTSAASSVVFEYNGPWELCVAFTPIYETSQDNCIVGSAESNRYYDNPSLELRTTNGVYTGCWFGFSNGNSTWNYGQAMTFNEPLVLNEEYILKMGIDADSHAYVTLTRVSTETIIMNSLSTETVSQTNNRQGRLALGSNARDGRFRGVANFNLAKSYYKENGVTLWGPVPGGGGGGGDEERNKTVQADLDFIDLENDNRVTLPNGLVWTKSSTYKYGTEESYNSPFIDNNELTTQELTFTPTKDGVLTVLYVCTSESWEYDYFKLMVDDSVKIDKYSQGNTQDYAWKIFSFQCVANQTETLVFSYQKDKSTVGGYDKAGFLIYFWE